LRHHSESSSYRSLQHLWCERDNPHEPAITQLATHRAEDTRSARGILCVDEHCGIVIEFDMAPVRTAIFAGRADDHRTDDIAFLHGRIWLRDLDRGDNRVPNTSILQRRAAEHADAHDLPCSAVVGHL